MVYIIFFLENVNMAYNSNKTYQGALTLNIHSRKLILIKKKS